MTLLRPLLLALAAALMPLPAAAGSGADAATVTLLPGWVTESGTRMAALRIALAPGWKTYWRAPGDAGIPPQFDWSGSENLAEVRFHWPRPEVHDVNGLRSIGYARELILPMELTPARPGLPIHVHADVAFGVCRDICVPLGARINLAMSSSGGERDPAIAAALAQRPETPREAGVGAVACQVSPIRDGMRLSAQIDMPPLGPDEVAVFELPDQSVWISEATGRREGSRLTVESDLVPAAGAPFLLERSEVTITVLGAGRAVELRGCPAG